MIINEIIQKKEFQRIIAEGFKISQVTNSKYQRLVDL